MIISKNEISDKIGVKFGVPQGSILDSVIFLIMIDSITKLDEENTGYVGLSQFLNWIYDHVKIKLEDEISAEENTSSSNCD